MTISSIRDIEVRDKADAWLSLQAQFAVGQETLGAQVVSRLGRWVAMQAPTGRRFCGPGREP